MSKWVELELKVQLSVEAETNLYAVLGAMNKLFPPGTTPGGVKIELVHYQVRSQPMPDVPYDEDPSGRGD